jgi:hypothetical protein
LCAVVYLQDFTFGDLVGMGRVGWRENVPSDEFWTAHTSSNEWAGHVQLLSASALYGRPILVFSGAAVEEVVWPGVDPAAPPIHILRTAATITPPPQISPVPIEWHHYDALLVVEVRTIGRNGPTHFRPRCPGAGLL